MNTSISARCLAIMAVWVWPFLLQAQMRPRINFEIAMPKPAEQVFSVIMQIDQYTGDSLVLKLPVWSPGYYQRLDYAKNLSNFQVKDAGGKDISWVRTAENTWTIRRPRGALRITYDIKATRPFVATSYLNTDRGYIIPASAFLYPVGYLQNQVTVTVKPYQSWKDIATGLEPVRGKRNTFQAENFDILYDSPILTSNLDTLPTFSVNGIPHRFIGFQLGEFDKDGFIADLKKIVTTSANLIGDIPYKHYTFIGIGPGQGGIEHLNSTTISFSGFGLQSQESRIRTMHFLAHEYFHHYNVKRIRPFELGPFDYDKGSRTNLLWVSEGLSVYYEYLVVKRAGVGNESDLFGALSDNMKAYENRSGRLYQSLVQASYETWSDGPFGRTGNGISYYDKGPVIGMMLDFAIRHFSNNQRSLDDVMRHLYWKYYKEYGRGFTDAEFQATCEDMAGSPLTELFEYVYTVKQPDYPKYFAYGGLQVDTALKEQQGTWWGLSLRRWNDTVLVNSIDEYSPAWNAGLRSRDVILEIDGEKATPAVWDRVNRSRMPGESITLKTSKDDSISITGETRKLKEFAISILPQPDNLQQKILDDWLGKNELNNR